MSKLDDESFTFWGALCLLAFIPLIRGGHTVWTALLAAGGTGALLWLRLIRQLWKGNLSFVWALSDLFLAAGLVWVLFSLSRPLAPPDSSDTFLILLGAAGLFFLVRQLSAKGVSLNLAAGLSLAAAALVLIGLFQILDLLPHSWWNPRRFVASTFVNHNHFAAYLELIFPLSCLALFAAPFRPPVRFLMAVSSVLIGAGLILTCSRGAWLSFILSLGIVGLIFILRARPVWNWQRTAVLAIALMAAGFVAAQPPIFSRGMTLLDAAGDASFQIRREIWQAAWNLVKENFFIGQGTGSFLLQFPRYRPAGLYWWINYAHNEYLQLVIELGLVGLLLALFIGFSILFRAGQIVARSHTLWKRALGAGGLIGLLSFGIHSFVDFHWHIPGVLYPAAAVAGLVTGIPFQNDVALKTFHFAARSPVPVRLQKAAAIFIFALGGFLAWPLGSLIAADFLAYQGKFELAAGLVPSRAVYHQKEGSLWAQKAAAARGSERHLYLKKAAEAYRRALERIPHSPWNAYAFAGVLKSLGNLQEADDWMNQAVQYDPNNPYYWKEWAELKFLQGESKEAAQGFKRAAELSKLFRFPPRVFEKISQADYFVERGKAEIAKGRAGPARTLFEIALEFDPDSEMAKGLLNTQENPQIKAHGPAVLAEDRIRLGQFSEAAKNLEIALDHDPQNIRALHLQIVLARRQKDLSQAKDWTEKLTAMNRPPVSQAKDAAGRTQVVWEPENGIYPKGKKIHEGWALFGKGTIQETLLLPPGKATFEILARGNPAGHVWPRMKLAWNGRIFLDTQVNSSDPKIYQGEIEILPGESQLSLSFTNDRKDEITGEDRNLKIDKVTVRWEDA